MCRAFSIALACFALGASAPAVNAGGPALELQLVASVPGSGVLMVTHAPGDPDRLFAVERSGNIYIIENGVLNPAPFLTIPGVDTTIEGGLLSMAFHPDYQSNGRFFVFYTETSAPLRSVVASYTVSADPNVANTAESRLLELEQIAVNHNGGWIGFSPNDGHLYISIGDDERQSAVRDASTLYGKILRVDVNGPDAFPGDTTRNYAIPADNPFAAAAFGLAKEVWALGLRNPYRCSFDRLNGDLYIADVGESDAEEINRQPASSTDAIDYGWPCREGTGCQSIDCCNTIGLTGPIYEIIRPAPVFVCSITGGHVYRGCAIPELDGTYFFGDFCRGEIASFDIATGTPTDINFFDPTLSTFSNVVGFGEDFFGEIYVCAINGNIHKIAPVIAPADANNNGIPDTCESSLCLADFDSDGDVDLGDFGIFGAAFNSETGDANYSAAADLDNDGDVDLGDFGLFGSEFNRTDC